MVQREAFRHPPAPSGGCNPASGNSFIRRFSQTPTDSETLDYGTTGRRDYETTDHGLLTAAAPTARFMPAQAIGLGIVTTNYSKP